MINFLHKPCCADAPTVDEISLSIKNKCKTEIENTELEHLMQLRIGTKKIPFIKMLTITDFPRFSEDEMVQKIFYGSYYLSLSKSYLADLIRNDNCAIIDEKVLQTTKIELSKKTKILQKIKNSLEWKFYIGTDVA